MLNANFFLVLNIYLSKAGFEDPDIADLISYRFLGMLAIALPLGFFLKSRKLKPLFYFSAAILPLATAGIVMFTELKILYPLYLCLFIWGVCFSAFQIGVLPYILRTEITSRHSEAIALHVSTWSASIFICGSLNFLLNRLSGGFLTESSLLLFFSAIALSSIYFIHKMNSVEKVPEKDRKRTDFKQYNWNLIVKAVMPRVIIAIGAGLTIQFINLFFYNVFHVDFDVFSLMGTGMAILVAFAVLSIPHIKRRFGYETAIVRTQSAAIFMLIILASTQFFSDYFIALIVAIACFILRQPLMNMAKPITSELSMYYVGKKNQEMVSAINASIWSGSWFFSGQVFKIMRSAGWEYSSIFYITAFFYSMGTLWYFFLIRDYNSRKIKEKSML